MHWAIPVIFSAGTVCILPDSLLVVVVTGLVISSPTAVTVLEYANSKWIEPTVSKYIKKYSKAED